MTSLKKIFTTALFVCLALKSFGMDFYPGSREDKPENKKMNWSTTEWGNSHDFDIMIPKSMKPGPYDTVRMRHNGQDMTVDTDISVGNLELGFWSKFHSEKKNIKVRWWLKQPMVGGSPRFRMEGGTLEVGRLWEFWNGEGGGSTWSYVDLIDVSSAVVKGCLTSVLNAAPVSYKNGSTQGVNINLEGKTRFEIGGVVLDPFYKTRPNELVFKFTFTEKDGNIPLLVISNFSDLTACNFDLVITSKVRAGRYPLIENNKRNSPADYKKFFINGKPYKIGDSVRVGDKSVTLVMDGKDRNSQDKNCVFVEVK